MKNLLPAALAALSLTACGGGAPAPTLKPTATTAPTTYGSITPAVLATLNALPYAAVSPAQSQPPAVGETFTLAAPVPVYDIAVQIAAEVGTVTTGVGSAVPSGIGAGTLGVTIIAGDAAIYCVDNGTNGPASPLVGMYAISYFLCDGNPLQ